MVRRTLLFLILGVTLACPAIAQEQQSAIAATCGPTQPIHAALPEKFGQTLAQEGITENGWVLEIWSDHDGLFTSFLTSPYGISCVFATGGNWSAPPPKAPESSGG